MENLELSKHDERNLKKYGFVTKKTYDFLYFLRSTLKLIFSLILISLIWFFLWWFIAILAWAILEQLGNLIISSVTLLSSHKYLIDDNMLSIIIGEILISMLFYPFIIVVSISLFLYIISYCKSWITFYWKDGILLFWEIKKK